jgi:hypothetical protein
MWLALFAAELLWLAFGPLAVYAPVGFIDPWLYTGYFRNFAYLLLHRGFTYYVSRLPWIIPGRLAFSIASPEFASLLLCAAIVTVSAISLYWAIRWHYGQVPGIIAALALITNAYFMTAAGWQYPDGAAIAYAMVAMALYLRPRGSPGWNGFLAAIALTLSGFTNMAGAPMILSLLMIPLLRWRRSAKDLVRQSLCALAGVAVTTILLMAVSKNVFGDARIFKPQFDQFLYTRDHPTYLTHMWGSGPGFLPTSMRLFMPAFLLVFGLVLLIAVRKPAAAAWPCYLALLICCSLYTFQEFALNEATLRVPYASSYMLVVVFCFAGVALGELWKHTESTGTAAIVAAAALGMLTVMLPFAYSRWPPLVEHAPEIWLRLVSVGVAGIGLAVLIRWPKPRLQYATCALVLFAISAGPGRDVHLYSGLREWKILPGSSFFQAPRAFQSLMRLQDYLTSNVGMQRDLVFWCDDDERLNGLFTSAAALYLNSCFDVTSELSSGSGRLFPGNTTVVNLTTHPEHLPKRIQLLASREVGVENERHIELSYAGIPVTVALQDLKMLTPLH